MKRKIVYVLMAMMLMMSACGKEDAAVDESREENIVVEDKEQEDEADIKEEKAEEDKNKEELPNWKGVSQTFGTYIMSKDKNIGGEVLFPSMVPTTLGRWAYQIDPALVNITYTETDENMDPTEVEALEDTFDATKSRLISRMELFRDHRYQDFDFVVGTSELMVVNGFDTCYYTGKHTYTCDGEAQEIPFVAYSFDTKQVEGCLYPYTIIVMDDSINNTTMEPLPEGTIEAYAKKMMESVTVE